MNDHIDHSPNAVRERVARALHQSSVSRAVDAAERVDISPFSLPNIFKRLALETETGRMLVYTSMIEDILKHILVQTMHNFESKKVIDDIFGGNGVLSTFSSRVSIAYHLGWITKNTKVNIDAIRKIRNIYAHKSYALEDGNGEHRKYMSAITNRIKPIYVALIDGMNSNRNSKDTIFHVDEFEYTGLVLLNLTFIAYGIIKDLIMLPAAQKYSVSASAVDVFDVNRPKNIRAIERDCVFLVSKIIDIYGKNIETTKSASADGNPDGGPSPDAPPSRRGGDLSSHGPPKVAPAVTGS